MSKTNFTRKTFALACATAILAFGAGCEQSENVVAGRELSEAVSVAQNQLGLALDILADPGYVNLTDTSCKPLDDKTLVALDELRQKNDDAGFVKLSRPIRLSSVDHRVIDILTRADTALKGKISDPVCAKADKKTKIIAIQVRIDLQKTIIDCLSRQAEDTGSKLIDNLAIANAMIDNVSDTITKMRYYEASRANLGTIANKEIATAKALLHGSDGNKGYTAEAIEMLTKIASLTKTLDQTEADLAETLTAALSLGKNVLTLTDKKSISAFARQGDLKMESGRVLLQKRDLQTRLTALVARVTNIWAGPSRNGDVPESILITKEYLAKGKDAEKDAINNFEQAARYYESAADLSKNSPEIAWLHKHQLAIAKIAQFSITSEEVLKDEANEVLSEAKMPTGKSASRMYIENDKHLRELLAK